MGKSCLSVFAFWAVLSVLTTSKAADCPNPSDTLLYACTQPLGVGFICTNQQSSGAAFCCSGCAFCSPGNPCGCMSCSPRPGSSTPAPPPSSSTTTAAPTTTTAAPPTPTTPPPPGTPPAPPGPTVIIIPAPTTPAPTG